MCNEHDCQTVNNVQCNSTLLQDFQVRWQWSVKAHPTHAQKQPQCFNLYTLFAVGSLPTYYYRFTHAQSIQCQRTWKFQYHTAQKIGRLISNEEQVQYSMASQDNDTAIHTVHVHYQMSNVKCKTHGNSHAAILLIITAAVTHLSWKHKFKVVFSGKGVTASENTRRVYIVHFRIKVFMFSLRPTRALQSEYPTR